MTFRIALLVAAALVPLSAGRAPGLGPPVLVYDSPKGFDRGEGEPETWIASTLDAVIHVYDFRPFEGDFADVFRRTLFRDRILPAYREHTTIGRPHVSSLTVKGAQAALTASFGITSGGAHREHLRAAVLASGRVALVDMSANSAASFDRNQQGFSTLLRSLSVVERRPAAGRPSGTHGPALTIWPKMVPYHVTP